MRKNYNLTGPIPLTDLSSEIVSIFIETYDLKPHHFPEKDPKHYVDHAETVTKFQLPFCFNQYIDSLQKNRTWSTEMIETGIHQGKNNIENLSPTCYPRAATQIIEGLSKIDTPTTGKILVVGSITPWIECILIIQGYTDITTCDYNDVKIDDSRIKFQPTNTQDNQQYDLIITFSSIEHDGLGRYGDPINPRGAFDAVEEMYGKLKRTGYLMCGIPVVDDIDYSIIRYNHHILFCDKTVNKLFSKFNIDTVIPWKVHDEQTGDYWQNQPIYICKKN